MPTFSNITIDIQWIVALSSGTYYNTWPLALAAALTLSNSNANAPVYIAVVDEQLSSAGASKVDLPGVGGPAGVAVGGGPILYAIALVSAATYYPKATAEAAAYALSTANANVPVYIAKPYMTVTSP